MSISPDLLETVTPADAGAARRLTTAAKVRDMIGSPAGDDTLLETIIDRISADAARYCNLAADVAGGFPTFGAETLRVTWYQNCRRRGEKIVLPWRQPFTAVTIAIEADTTLTVGTDCRLLSQAGDVLRLSSGDAPTCWSSGKIVVTFTAGWSLPGGVPPDVEAAVIAQASMVYQGRDRDPAMRSFQIPDVYQEAVSAPGGDTIDETGLLPQTKAALQRYWLPAVA